MVIGDSAPVLAAEHQGRWYDVSRLARESGLPESAQGMPHWLGLDAPEADLSALCARAGVEYQLPEPIRFALPFRPGKVVAIGRNYRAHVAEFDNKMPREPIYFCKASSACVGQDEPIVVREDFGRVDHEGELGVVIGRLAKNVPAERARDYIAGYTIVNDVTAREVQKRDMGDGQPWFRSKSIDTFCPIGPAILLRDAMPWPVRVNLETRVNGEVRQQSNTEKFIFDIPCLVEAITRFMSLEPGDIIATGTPEGVSPIHPGDVIEVGIPGIGVLRNPVVKA